LIGNASADDSRVEDEVGAEAFSIRRLEGRRWRLRRTRCMGIGCRFDAGMSEHNWRLNVSGGGK